MPNFSKIRPVIWDVRWYLVYASVSKVTLLYIQMNMYIFFLTPSKLKYSLVIGKTNKNIVITKY